MLNFLKSNFKFIKYLISVASIILLFVVSSLSIAKDNNIDIKIIYKLLQEKILGKNFQELNLDSIKQLESACEILKSAIDQLKKGKSDMEHFGD